MPSNSYKVNSTSEKENKKSLAKRMSEIPESAENTEKETNEETSATTNGGTVNPAFSTSEPLPSEGKKKEKWMSSYVPAIFPNSKKMSNGQSGGAHPTSNGNGHLVRQVSEIFDEVFKEPRGNWATKGEFITSIMGMSAAFSSFWRFPYLIMEFGGGAFLLCYIILFLLVGLPMFYMEAAISQYAQLGPVHVWRCLPLLKGIGVGMVILSLITSVFNGQVIAYAVHYFFSSFINMDGNVVWGSCEPSWRLCFDTNSNLPCSTANFTFTTSKECLETMKTSTQYYWENEILHLTELQGPGQTGEFPWDICLSLLFVWFSVFVFLVQGIKSSGKVAYVTGVLPFGILIAFLVVSCMAPGALKGLQEFYKPEWEALMFPNVWQKALEQLFFTLGITYGAIYMFSSYNRFRNKIHVDAFALSSVNLIVSVIAATTIFALYGALAEKMFLKPRDLLNIEMSSLELLFSFYPNVIARILPMPHVWSIFFFFMLMCLGLHSQVALVETCLTAVYDALPRMRRRKYLATLCLVIPLFLLSLPLCASTGFHMLLLLETSIIGPNVILLAIFELFALQIFYGVKRYSEDLRLMLGGAPSIFWRFFWVFGTPVTLIVLFVFSCIEWEYMVFLNNKDDDDLWFQILRWTLTLLPLAVIPFTFIFTLFYKLCVKEPVFRPSPLWGPGCPDMKKEYIETTRRRHMENGAKKSKSRK